MSLSGVQDSIKAQHGCLAKWTPADNFYVQHADGGEKYTGGHAVSLHKQVIDSNFLV